MFFYSDSHSVPPQPASDVLDAHHAASPHSSQDNSSPADSSSCFAMSSYYHGTADDSVAASGYYSENASDDQLTPASPNHLAYATYAFSPSPHKNEENARIGQAIKDILDQDETPASQVAATQNKRTYRCSYYRHAPWKIKVMRRHYVDNPYCTRDLKHKLSEELSLTPQQIMVSTEYILIFHFYC